MDDWQVPAVPRQFVDRRVEIAAPAYRLSTVVNALNSGARVWVADLEDATSPTWPNLLDSQANVAAAVRGRIDFRTPSGRRYRLAGDPAVIVLRPRAWHLPEPHFPVDGAPAAASIVDAGLFLFHNAVRLVERGSTPLLYLPKLEGAADAALWASVFAVAEDTLGLSRGTIRAPALIETVGAAFEMDGILRALGPYAAGLTAGRWDYLFSIIRDAGDQLGAVLPDRSALTMSVPFLRAYTDLLVHTCHRRGTHAIGGPSAVLPDRRDAAANEAALAAIRRDKQQEARAGFDGAWVVHPDAVPVCAEVFGERLGGRPHQITMPVNGAPPRLALLDFTGVPRAVTEGGVRSNIAVALRYLAGWLSGRGSVAVFGMMEGLATVEIARAQLWQWHAHGTPLSDGRPVTAGLLRSWVAEEYDRCERDPAVDARHLPGARSLLLEAVLAGTMPRFLSTAAYELLLASPADKGAGRA
ncbi:MAG: malate synthase A [Catenulispora sp.]|nr:malate synthase A [Catenulispora sp.]